MSEWRALANVEGDPLLGGSGDARILQFGGNGLLLEVRFAAGVSSVEHRHAHDSYLYLVSGRISSTVGGERIKLKPGQSLIHRAGISHSVTAAVDSRWLEFKAPAPRVTEDANGSLTIAPDQV